DRLGGIGGLAVEPALVEEDIEEQPADAGKELNHRGKDAGDERYAAPFDVRAHRLRQHLHHERHQPEQDVDRRLVGNVGDAAHHREGQERARDIPIEDRPEHEAPPMQRPPAVGGDLQDREQHHAGGDVEINQQHAEQNHAAGHAEHAGDERGDDDGEADEGKRGGGHYAALILTSAIVV